MLYLALRAIICSIFRVQTTIYMTFGTSDTTYAFGPVILWAQAEMACGFFIASAPSLPRVLSDTPWLSRLFGLRSTSDKTPVHGNTSLRTFGGSGPATGKGHSRSTGTGDAYCQIDDDIPLEPLESTGSSKELQREKLRAAGFITATTEITVTHDKRLPSRNTGTPEAGQVTPWASLDSRK